MSKLWLTPVLIGETEQTVTLLNERVELQPAEAADRFLAWMKSVHSRMLMSFKSNLLLSEEAELACGVDELPFELDSDEPVIFGIGPLELSFCAQAYIDRLPSHKEMGEWLEIAVSQASGLREDDPAAQWVELMRDWHRHGYLITILKEENRN